MKLHLWDVFAKITVLQLLKTVFVTTKFCLVQDTHFNRRTFDFQAVHFFCIAFFDKLR